VRDRCSPALPLGGAPGRQHDHRLVQNVEGARAHVTEGSRRAFVPRRRPAPEGGGAAAPASSWRRQNAQNGRISSMGFLLTACRRRRRAQKRREGVGEGTWQRRRIGRRSGGRGAAPTSVGNENLQQHKLDKPLAIPRTKKEERGNQSYTGGGGKPRRRC
jgi:hypothetical protein